MGKFSAAKSFDATDKRLQTAVNYLIELIETGYVAEGLVGEHRVRVDVNSQQGLAMTVDGEQVISLNPLTGLLELIGGIEVRCDALNALAVMNAEKIGFYDLTSDDFIGGLTNVGGDVGLIAKVLTNSDSPDFYATVGDVSVSGIEYHGMLGYLTSDEEEPEMPVFSLVSRILDYGGGDYEYYCELLSKYKNAKAELIDSDGGASISRIGVSKTAGFSDIAAADDYAIIQGYDNTNDHTSKLLVDPDAIKHTKSTGSTEVVTELPQMQFGTEASVSSSAWSSVTFPTAFPTGTTVKVFPGIASETAGVIAAKIRNESTTGFEVTIGGSGFSGISVNWLALSV